MSNQDPNNRDTRPAPEPKNDEEIRRIAALYDRANPRAFNEATGTEVLSEDDYKRVLRARSDMEREAAEGERAKNLAASPAAASTPAESSLAFDSKSDVGPGVTRMVMSEPAPADGMLAEVVPENADSWRVSINTDAVMRGEVATIDVTNRSKTAQTFKGRGVIRGR